MRMACHLDDFFNKFIGQLLFTNENKLDIEI